MPSRAPRSRSPRTETPQSSADLTTTLLILRLAVPPGSTSAWGAVGRSRGTSWLAATRADPVSQGIRWRSRRTGIPRSSAVPGTLRRAAPRGHTAEPTEYGHSKGTSSSTRAPAQAPFRAGQWRSRQTAIPRSSVTLATITNRASGPRGVYTRSAGGWSQQGDKLVGSGAIRGCFSGLVGWHSRRMGTPRLSAVSRTTPLLAPPGSSRAAEGSGRRQGGELVGAGADGPAWQGYSLAMSADGKTVLLGGPGNYSGAGAAWVFVGGGATGTDATASPGVAPHRRSASTRKARRVRAERLYHAVGDRNWRGAHFLSVVRRDIRRHIESRRYRRSQLSRRYRGPRLRDSGSG